MTPGFGPQQLGPQEVFGRKGWEWGREGRRGGRKAFSSLLCLLVSPVVLTGLSLPQEASLLALRQNQQWIFLETLAPDTPYELQVRARAQQGSLLTWSPWSQPLAFRTRPEDQLLTGRRPDGAMGVEGRAVGLGQLVREA